ncbi:MAG: aminopeptidase P family protein [Desulfobacteraceae bacterium]|nr:aminopeptidase P family protein [Desulfobacteraceae bacterium]
MYFEQNRDKLLAQIDADVFMVVNLEDSDPSCMYYLSGFSGEGVLLVSAGDTVLITDRRYAETARREVPGLTRVIIETEYAAETADILRQQNYGRVGFASKRISYWFADKIITASGADIVPMADPVAMVRMVKAPAEIEKIKASIQVMETALGRVMEHVRTGMTEKEIAWALEREMCEAGATGPAFPVIVAAGENSALPHHQPGNRPLRNGDLLLCDIGARLDGYCSDMTRVFSVGPPGERAKQMYKTVLNARRKAMETIRPGRSGCSVDAAAFDVIIAAGYEGLIAHRLGHGVGLEVHEGPRLSPVNGETRLMENMILALEPGIYDPGFGGIRIEDMVRVTRTCCELLTGYPGEELICVG